MTFRNTLSCIGVVALVSVGTAAHAGKDTVPNTITVLSPATFAVVQTSLGRFVNRGGLVQNADGSVTFTSPNRVVRTFTSVFVASFVSSYTQ